MERLQGFFLTIRRRPFTGPNINNFLQQGVLGISGMLAVLVIICFTSYKYWHTFTKEKWMEYRERRAGMTADLLENYELFGMTEGIGFAWSK